MKAAYLATCFLTTLGVHAASTIGGNCASDNALGNAVCEEVHAEMSEADTNPIGMQMLQVEKVRIASSRAELMLGPAVEAAKKDAAVAEQAAREDAGMRVEQNASEEETEKWAIKEAGQVAVAEVGTNEVNSNSATDLVDEKVVADDASKEDATKTTRVHVGSKAEFPSLDDIIQNTRDVAKSVKDQVRDVAKSVKDQVRDVTKSVKDQVRDIGRGAYNGGANVVTDIAGSAATIAAVQVASALNKTLLALDHKAVQLKPVWRRLGERVAKGLNETFENATDELSALEENIKSTIGSFMPFWGNISEDIRLTTSVASGVLKTLGLDSYVTMLNDNVGLAMENNVAIARALTNATQLIHGVSKLAADEAVRVLLMVNASFEDALDWMEESAEQLDVAFEDLTSHAAAGLESTVTGINATEVDDSFATVRANAKQIVNDIFDGPLALITGLTEATTKVEVDLGGPRGGAAAQGFARLLLLGMLTLTIHL